MSTEIRKAVYAETARRIEHLLRHRETGSGKATLANLRRGIGKAPGELPELWGIIFRDMPEELLSQYGNPSPAEWAIYIALTMFALHQQGTAEPVHTEKLSLGRAYGKLRKEQTEEEEERLLRRFNQVVTASDLPELSHYLRGMIQLLRADGIGLDYARLASDLYLYQSPQTRMRVQLKWGQDFYYQSDLKKE